VTRIVSALPSGRAAAYPRPSTSRVTRAASARCGTGGRRHRYDRRHVAVSGSAADARATPRTAGSGAIRTEPRRMASAETREYSMRFRGLGNLARAPRCGELRNGLVILLHGREKPDTRNPTSKLMLTILAGVVTWGAVDHARAAAEGIASAKAAGKYKGRPVSIDATEGKALAQIMGRPRLPRSSGSPAAASTGC
jgi:hypothetical protein